MDVLSHTRTSLEVVPNSVACAKGGAFTQTYWKNRTGHCYEGLKGPSCLEGSGVAAGGDSARSGVVPRVRDFSGRACGSSSSAPPPVGAETLTEVFLCDLPAVVHGTSRTAQRGGRLCDGKSAEETELDETGEFWVGGAQAL